MDKIDLPGGAWAQLRDPDAVTERQRKPFLEEMGRVAKASAKDATDISLLDMIEVQNALVLALVDSWSLDAPLTPDGILDVPHRVLGALRDACQPLQAALLPDFGPTPDPESPSAPSNA